MRRWWVWCVAGVLIIWAYSCGSGSDEIFITCTNNGPGDIACGANGGSSVDRNVDPTPTGR